MNNTLKERFEKVFKGKRLLAIHLDGFSHSIFFDSGNKDSMIEREEYSGYTHNTKELEYVFQGIGHLSYQNNAKEIVYVYPNKR